MFTESPHFCTVVGCWAHLRRKLDEAMKSLPKGKAKGSSASQGLAYCNLLFAIEQGLSEKKATEKSDMTSGWSRQNLF